MAVDPAGDGPLVCELSRLRAELAAQRQLSAMTVHDLANPAQVILGLSELLLEHEDVDPVVRRGLEQVYRSAVTMRALITDLSVGLALEGPDALEVRRVNLVDLVASVVERTQVLAAEKSIELLVQQPDDQGCWVQGDAVKLERALTNLLNNAVKFSPARSTVSVALNGGVQDVEIAVQDQGPGIEEQAKERVFEAFHREDPVTDPPGQGLGLFIVKQVAESHGGTISVESEAGDGARFVLRLPLAVEARLAKMA